MNHSYIAKVDSFLVQGASYDEALAQARKALPGVLLRLEPIDDAANLIEYAQYKAKQK